MEGGLGFGLVVLVVLVLGAGLFAATIPLLWYLVAVPFFLIGLFGPAVGCLLLGLIVLEFLDQARGFSTLTETEGVVIFTRCFFADFFATDHTTGEYVSPADGNAPSRTVAVRLSRCPHSRMGPADSTGAPVGSTAQRRATSLLRSGSAAFPGKSRQRDTGVYAIVCLSRPVMSFQFSLYDALVGIDVPAEKARAVVDALDRDMGATLATKRDILLLRQELKQEIDLLRKDIDHFQKEMEHFRRDVARDMELLRSNMTVRLGSMQVVTAGLLFAALKLT